MDCMHFQGTASDECQCVSVEWEAMVNIKLLLYHNDFGNKWTAVAEKLGSISDNIVKNHFYSMARKELKRLETFDIVRSLPSQLIISYYFRKLFLSLLTYNKGKVNYLKTIISFEKLNIPSVSEYVKSIERFYPAIGIRGWKNIATEYVENYTILDSIEFPTRLLPTLHLRQQNTKCAINDRAQFALAWQSSKI